MFLHSKHGLPCHMKFWIFVEFEPVFVRQIQICCFSRWGSGSEQGRCIEKGHEVVQKVSNKGKKVAFFVGSNWPRKDKRNPKKLVNKHPYSNDEFTGLAESKISLTVVGLGGETLCQTRISPNSTVMNVRCAIAEEAGIPIQSQQLVHGCTKLSDPSAKLVVDTQEETVEITCVRSSVEPQDLCTWCGGVLGVPVESLCPCKKLYCITCIRDMIGLNGESAKSRTCPICHHVLSRSKAWWWFGGTGDSNNNIQQRSTKLQNRDQLRYKFAGFPIVFSCRIGFVFSYLAFSLFKDTNAWFLIGAFG